VHNPKYVFRDGQEPPAFHVFIGHGEWEESTVVCAPCVDAPGNERAAIREREFPLYADDLDAMRPSCECCAVTCERCERVWHGGPEFVVYVEPEPGVCNCGVVVGSHDSECPLYPAEVGRIL
jgi:hypothetical protein